VIAAATNHRRGAIRRSCKRGAGPFAATTAVSLLLRPGYPATPDGVPFQRPTIARLCQSREARPA
jgi:hypothetical protein